MADRLDDLEVNRRSLTGYSAWGNVKDSQLVDGPGAISISRAGLRDSHTSFQDYFLNLHFQQSPFGSTIQFLAP